MVQGQGLQQDERKISTSSIKTNKGCSYIPGHYCCDYQSYQTGLLWWTLYSTIGHSTEMDNKLQGAIECQTVKQS